MSRGRQASRSAALRPYAAMQPSRSSRKRRTLATSRRISKIIWLDAKVRSVSRMLIARTPDSRQGIDGVDQHESDATGLGAAIDPGVVGALLPQHVAGLEMDLAIVEQHVDLARQDDGVIDAARAMHRMVARRPRLAAGVTLAHLARHVVGRQCELVGAGREI